MSGVTETLRIERGANIAAWEISVGPEVSR